MKRTLRNIPIEAVTLDGDWFENQKLTASIAAQGVLHPIHVYQDDDEYPIVAGRGRVTSARALGLTTIEAFVYPTELQALAAIALAENVRRGNPLSDARNLAISGLGVEEARDTSGMTKAQYDAAMRLLTLVDPLLERLERGHLSATAAARLARLQPNDQRRAMELADDANAEGRKREKGPTLSQYDTAIKEVKFEKQIPLSAFAIPQAQATGNERINYLALVGQLTRLEGDCPNEILQPLLDWLENFVGVMQSRSIPRASLLCYGS